MVARIYNEIILRIFLFIIYVNIRDLEPWEVKIQPEEMWYYKYPKQKSIVPSKHLWIITILFPLFILFVYSLFYKKYDDLRELLLAYSLGMIMTLITTIYLKICTGKLRPDFYWRCFPSGSGNEYLKCNGIKSVVQEGRKSFPSGHSSLSFSSMSFLTYFFMSKLHVFNYKGRANGWKLIISIIPIFIALFVSTTRIIDSHHHSRDVIAGCLLGLFFNHVTYRHYYPSLFEEKCDIPYIEHIKEYEEEETTIKSD